MFEIGFFELVVIALVTLIVVGPERLPEVARASGRLIGRIRSYLTAVKADVSQELSLQEYYKLHNRVLDEAKAAGQSVEDEARRLELAMLEKLHEEKKDNASPAGQDRV